MKPWGKIKSRLEAAELKNRELYVRIWKLEREARRQARGEPGTLLWMERQNKRGLVAVANPLNVRIVPRNELHEEKS